MKILYPIFFGAALVAAFGLIEILLLKKLNKRWWSNKLIKWSAIGLPIVGVIALSSWLIGFYRAIDWLYKSGATVTAVTLVLLVSLMLSLPISGVFNWILGRFEKQGKKDKVAKPINENRRAFLKGAAAALPVTTIAMSVGGVGRAFGDTEVYVRDFAFKNLPSDLEGLKILHLTDLHLGIYKFLPDLEDILVQAEKHGPDIVLMTGDVADELRLFPDTLKMISEIKAPYGHFACLGNHEYYRGIRDVMRMYDNGPMPLLRSTGAEIMVKDTPVYIVGSDDPVIMRHNPRPFIQQSIEQGLNGGSDSAFKILMCHRPEGFDPAVDMKIDLTLSGHTHGGQVGFNGRSFFDIFLPDRYLWGPYAKNDSQMYLSSGIGHWFPFRLGCPTEAPIIRLTSKA